MFARTARSIKCRGTYTTMRVGTKPRSRKKYKKKKRRRKKIRMRRMRTRKKITILKNILRIIVRLLRKSAVSGINLFPL
jgi:hypothetical protein